MLQILCSRDNPKKHSLQQIIGRIFWFPYRHDHVDFARGMLQRYPAVQNPEFALGYSQHKPEVIHGFLLSA